ncbi:magnesium and cobalt transport protein CorA [Streptacidiphilus monticola]|uniref:Magnesium and cobalt transport protein CorA n=1 Tax=Streptacidiphilus monticola TaxID=2161674 RepID=A0ABW1GAZ7_9ACTN
MSMIRDLRSAVLPRRGATLDDTRTATLRAGDAVVDCAVYREGRRVTDRCGAGEAVAQLRDAGRQSQGDFVWIGLHEPTEEEFAGIAARFGLHPLAVEDAVHAHQRPKLERYDDVLFAVFKTIRYVEHDRLTPTSDVVSTGEVMVFLGPDFVITVRHGSQGSLRPLRRRLESDAELLAKGPSVVLHAVADLVVDGYLSVTDELQTDVDEVEFSVFSQRNGRGSDAGRIYQLKREVLEFKRACAPLTRPLASLSTTPNPLVDPEVQAYFRDVADHLARVNEQVLAFDELLNSILQANLAQVTVVQNEDMRKITAWAAILAVPTMVTGVYGMNFDNMPELHWHYGYPAVLAGILLVCFLIYRGFRKNKWL